MHTKPIRADIFNSIAMHITIIWRSKILYITKAWKFNRLTEGHKSDDYNTFVIKRTAGPSGRAVYGVGLRPLLRWDCGFESHRGHGCLLCCVLSGRGLCDGLITRPEESYQLQWFILCDLETSWTRRPWPIEGCLAKNKQSPGLWRRVVW